MDQTLFTQLGLNPKSATVYETLLTRGPLPAQAIAEETNMKRPTVYVLLDELKKTGLATERKMGKKTVFVIEHPNVLRQLAERQLQTMESLVARLDRELPALASDFERTQTRPGIQVFEGKEGLKRVFQDIYGPGKDEVYGAVTIEKVDAVFPKVLAKQLIPQRIKNHILAKSFIGDTPAGRTVHKNDKKQYRQSILLNPKKYPLPAEIDVYNDKIAMLSFERGEFVGLLIQNKAFADTLKSLLALAFELAKNRQSGR
jgi:sugar-specific transcriptional regulator TrmB